MNSKLVTAALLGAASSLRHTATLIESVANEIIFQEVKEQKALIRSNRPDGSPAIIKES